MSQTEYPPWTVVTDMEIPTGVTPMGFTFVRVPWVAAGSPEAVVVTASFVAEQVLQALQAAHAVGRAAERRKALEEAIFEPPLVRFHCPGCDDSWDAWVNDDGHLEDPRDTLCGSQGCERQGQAADIVQTD